MKIEELLQKILDIAMSDETVDQEQVQSAEDDEPTGIFMPPLQTSIELMKKATGTDNVIDDEESEDFESEWLDMEDDGEECACQSEDDPLIAIRRNAGLPYGAEPMEPEAVVISNTNLGPGF